MANIPENTTNPILRPVTRLETTTKVFGGEYIPDDAQQRGISNLQAIELAERDQYILSRVGQPYVPESGDIPAKAGIAGLDTSGRVPKTQLPTATVYTEETQTLKNKTIDYGDVTGGNVLKCTPKTYTTGDVTLTSSEMAKELSVVMSSSYMCLTIQNAPYNGYRLSITATTTGYIKFKGRQGNDVVLCIDARQTLYLINETSNYWTVEPGCCLIVDNNKINNAPWINPSDQTQGRWHPNDWRVFLGFGVFSFNYQQTSDTYYNLPDLSTFVVVSSTHQNRAVATAQKWSDKTTGSPIWTRKNHDGWATFWTLIPPKNEVVSHDNISNCITEIPQDIKLTLSSGTLTLKAGSKVYVPNGVGVFEAVTINTDLSSGDVSAISYPFTFFVNSTRTGLSGWRTDLCVSGTTAPATPPTGQMWYDTSTNSIKRWSGSAWVGGFSLPICILSSGATSIDQVFNGMGYIGKKVFVLPGVKYLIPNGRNADGTLKNIDKTTASVSVSTNEQSNWNRVYLLSSGSIDKVNNYIYNENLNLHHLTNDDTAYRYVVYAGTVSLDSSDKIINFEPKTTFHAVDWNDVMKGSGREHTATTETTVSSGTIKYLVQNGICFVNIDNLTMVATGANQFIATLPKQKLSTSGITITNYNGTQLCGVMYINANKLYYSCSVNGNIFASFSYPVADDWAES